jgi:predicted nucleic acid-binding protein
MKLFFDTAPFIYLTENHPIFASQVKKIITDAIQQQDTMITSVVTLAEFGIMPTRKDRSDLIVQFENFLDNLNIDILQVRKNDARKAYELRAKYQFLKGMDAFQLAIAINENCDQFVTNDKKLEKVSEIKVVTLENE